MHIGALTVSGGAKCWGYNRDGQVGDGSFQNPRLTPVDVFGLTGGVAAIDAADSHTCALAIGGGAKCWGDNWYGPIGDGSWEHPPDSGQCGGLGERRPSIVTLSTTWSPNAPLNLKLIWDNVNGKFKFKVTNPATLATETKSIVYIGTAVTNAGPPTSFDFVKVQRVP